MGTAEHTSIEERVTRIRSVLREVTSEASLVAELSSQLESLREVWRADPGAFSDAQIEFLRETRVRLNALGSFIECVDELPLLRDLAEAARALARLRRIAQVLGSTGVQRRVLREIRALREQLPELGEL